MQDSWDAGHLGFRTAGMQDSTHGFRTAGMQERRDAGLEE